MRRWGIILLSIWLILSALLTLLNLGFSGSGIVLAVLALAAGILLILGGAKSNFRGNWGILLLGIWLILRSLFSLLNLSFTGSGIVLAILAIAAGVLLLLGR
jgi:hypothetical protein